MAIPAWFWPPSGAAARSVAISPYGSGLMAAPDWRTPTVWLFSVSGARYLGGLVLPSGGVNATNPPGLAMAVPDATSGLWTVGYDGSWWHLNASGASFIGRVPSSGALFSPSSSGVLPSGQVYVGCAAPNASAFFLTATGTVLTSGGALIGAWPSAPALGFGSSGTTLATLLPTSGVVGTMDAGTGATGQIALPAAITVPSCLAVASGSLAIAGWQTAPTLSGAFAFALNPQDPDTLASVGTGHAVVYRAIPSTAFSGENWQQASVLTGLNTLSDAAWTPDGIQLLATSTVSGNVQALGYSAGLLSLAQTLAVSGACSVMTAGTSIDALVAQSGQSQLAVLSFASTWSTGTPITGLPGVVAVAPFGSTGAVAAWTSGVTFVNLTTGGWAVGPSAATSFVPTVLAVDQFLQVYVAGSGALAVFDSSGNSIGSGSWAGAAPSSIAVQDGRVVLAVPSDDRLYIYGESDVGAWTRQSFGALPAGAVNTYLGLSLTTLFVGANASTTTYGFSGTPFALSQVTSGAAAQWDGSSWTTTILGIGHNPSCCAFDASGNLQVATVQNTLWSITSGGIGTSGIVAQYSGQDQTVPMGPSAILASGGGLYVATSMAGVLVRVA